MLRERNVAACIILSLFTCGLYALYWEVSLINDVNRASDEADTSGLGVLLLSFITCGLFGIYWSYKMGGKINKAWERTGRSSDPNLGLIYVLLTILSFGIITWCLVQNEINKLARA